VVKGFDLALCFDRPANASEGPLTLIPDPTAATAEALFDVQDSSLELSNVRIVFPNGNAIMPSRVLRLKGGDLRLHGCWLQGPLDKGPAAFKALIEFHGSGAEQAEAGHSLAALQTALLAGPRVLQLQGGGARIRMQQCLVLAAQDAFDCRWGPQAPSRLNVQWLLEHNTFAIRRNLLAVGDLAGATHVAEPMVVQAEANLFADPFTETPRTSCLLAIPAATLQRGAVLWQGTSNAYDATRWQSFVSVGEASSKTTHAAWQQLWGHAGERDAVMVDWPPAPPSTFPIGTPQLDRLRPPGAAAVYGADLSKVGTANK
jgi:hypothetical protein